MVSRRGTGAHGRVIVTTPARSNAGDARCDSRAGHDDMEEIPRVAGVDGAVSWPRPPLGRACCRASRGRREGWAPRAPARPGCERPASMVRAPFDCSSRSTHAPRRSASQAGLRAPKRSGKVGRNATAKINALLGPPRPQPRDGCAMHCAGRARAGIVRNDHEWY